MLYCSLLSHAALPLHSPQLGNLHHAIQPDEANTNSANIYSHPSLLCQITVDRHLSPKPLIAFDMSLAHGSVTDIVSAAGAVKALITTLIEAQNAPSEYQATIRELENFDAVLGDLQEMARLCERF